MPKLGMEPIRRSALVEATIAELASKGSLDVTVGQIAKRAGMSSALAHHYFGGKDQIFLAAMRQILRDFGAEVRRGLRAADGRKARAIAIIEASFSSACFSPQTVSAWMTLYAQAQTNAEMLRLLRLYQKRLKSNLCHALRPLTPEPEAQAELLAALIDGLYLRAALSRSQSPDDARQKTLDMLTLILEPRP
ncbi:transcriptional regulator BetI [uncultured Roseobacter sp.]|uniref:choline-binding transcriptional repressor BetI n=1 Tax=uncultured Roseobacter sp. TaxID=114847 RepID=UPI0026111086|nr:transcriptional regulator BetI [uncultured Roseobacter sp.]